MTSLELYRKLTPNKTENYTAQLLNDGLSVNLSGFYTKLIKDAARCNDYSSDIVFDINGLNKKLKEFRAGQEFEPVWIGCRKMGVDGTDFVLARTEGDYAKLHKNYFALYSVTVDRTDPDWYQITVSEYNM